jgi:hypothetical protein
MTTWYYKTNDEWYVINSNHSFRSSWYADIVIKIRDDGSGQIMRGTRHDIPDLLTRKYMPNDVIAKDELLPIVLRAQTPTSDDKWYMPAGTKRHFPVF